MIFKDDVAAPEVVIKVIIENIAYFLCLQLSGRLAPQYSVNVLFFSIGKFIQNGHYCCVNIRLKVYANI